MWTNWKRIFALLLAVALVCAAIPAGMVRVAAAEFEELAEAADQIATKADIEIDIPINPGVQTGDPLTLSFANSANRTECTAEKQVWSQNGITVINEKTDTSNDVGSYVNPVRFFADSKLTVAYSDMSKIVFKCYNSTYAKDLCTSLNTQSGINVTQKYAEVTVEFTQPQASFVIEKLEKQVRVSSITIYPYKHKIPTNPIALKSMNMQLGSSLSLNLNGFASVLDEYENVYVIYQPKGGEPVKVTRYFESISSDGTLRYNFAYEGLTILDVNLPIYYTIYGTYDGKEYHSETKTTSLLKYCQSCLNSYQSATVACANLIEYAMAAEAYVKEERPETDDTNFLVNVLTEAEMAKVKQYAYADDQLDVEKKSLVENNADPIKFSSQALNMLSRITMLYKVKITDPTLDTSRVTFKVTYTDVYGSPAEKTYAFSDLEYEVSTGSYVLSFSEFHATQMREMAKCTIYIDGVKHSSYNNSIENYCYTAMKDTNLSNAARYLARRISLYGDACYATFH